MRQLGSFPLKNKSCHYQENRLRNAREHFLTGFPGNGNFYSSTEKNQVVSYYYLHHLDGVIDKEQCKGKFKEVYGKTHEEDNPILIIYTFK